MFTPALDAINVMASLTCWNTVLSWTQPNATTSTIYMSFCHLMAGFMASAGSTQRLRKTLAKSILDKVL